jgi:8-oxo-dGTP diphosphatase
MSDKKFNVRVYGIAINERDEVLVSDELIKGLQFTKFPGGGLEWGEGLRDCLVREFMEELSQPIEVLEHIYTTDYFQVSAFRETDQLISIYFKVKLIEPLQFTVKHVPFDFPNKSLSECEVQRWVNRSSIHADNFRWPVDRIVATKLLKGDF